MTDMSDQRSTVHITFLSFRKVPDSVITLNTLGKYDLDYRIIEEAEHLVVDFSGLCQLNWGDKKCLQWLFLDSVIFITAINNLDRYFLSEKKKSPCYSLRTPGTGIVQTAIHHFIFVVHSSFELQVYHSLSYYSHS